MEKEYTLAEEDKKRMITERDDVLAVQNHNGFKVIKRELQREADDALMGLKIVDPEDFKEIRRLQNIVWRFEGFYKKIAEIVNNGEAVHIGILDEHNMDI